MTALSQEDIEHFQFVISRPRSHLLRQQHHLIRHFGDATCVLQVPADSTSAQITQEGAQDPLLGYRIPGGTATL